MSDHAQAMEEVVEAAVEQPLVPGPDEETAKELIAKTADGVTLDTYMLRQGGRLSPEERLELVQIQRRDRARFALGEGKRKRKGT